MTLEEFLKLDQPEAYDFREEIVAFHADDDEIKRHIVYKAIGIAEEDLKDGSKSSINVAYNEAKKIYDEHHIFAPEMEADSCELMQLIFEKIWKSDYLLQCMDESLLKRDTMNSIQTTINKLLKIRSNRKMVQQYAQNPETIMLSIRECPYSLKFLGAAYSIGNFVPCPRGCNRPGTSETKDYWDLTLYHIYQWYHITADVRDIHLKKIFRGKHEVEHIANYTSWLNTFGCWDTFVDSNYMAPFVHRSTDSKGKNLTERLELDDPKGFYGPPKELWKGHFSSKSALPEGVPQINEFFKNAAEFIQARSKLMVDALRDAENNA